MTLHAGLAWGVHVASDSGSEAEIRARINGVVSRRVWTVFTDDQHVLAPDHALTGSGMSRNAWAVLDNGSPYWPSHAELAAVVDSCNGWLNDVDGAPIRTRWGLRLFDVRHPTVRDFFIEQTQRLLYDYRAGFLFLDECYDHRWPSVRVGYSVVYPLPGVEGSLGWDASMQMILRRCRSKTVINGPYNLDLSPGMLDGIYVQNADRLSLTTLHDRLKDSQSRGFRRTCIQVPVARSLEYQTIAAQYLGVSVQEIPYPPAGQFDCPVPSVEVPA